MPTTHQLDDTAIFVYSLDEAIHDGVLSKLWPEQWSEITHGKPLVVCYVRDGDWVISAKGAIRCKKLRVLAYHEE